METTPIVEYSREMIIYALERGDYSDWFPLRNEIANHPYSEFVENLSAALPYVDYPSVSEFFLLKIMHARGIPVTKPVVIERLVDFQGC